ncbi:MAG: phosphoribosyl-ATP diphosphatase, partial [Pseudomonadales bacterium]
AGRRCRCSVAYAQLTPSAIVSGGVPAVTMVPYQPSSRPAASMDIIDQLTKVLDARRAADPQTSYVAALYEQGLDKILEKVGEEATEVLIAAKNLETDSAEKNRTALVGEVADLWFHSLVMLMQLNVQPTEVSQRLQDRFGLSGLAEKASRGATSSDAGQTGH